ncbi:MAG: ribosome assembly factor SBDS [Thermoprotei archaeon]|nr:MAG: ribosome assembly factor SBDS [Thermoprotei archaeon]
MSKHKLTVARLERAGKKFEIIVHVDKAWKFKNGEKIDIRDILEGEFIYYDVRQGLKASETELKKIFGTSDPYQVAEQILKRGELLLTAEQRRELIERKRRQIIEFLAKNAIDPRTNLPIPPKRIELALEQARVGIDPFKPVEAQINDIIKALRLKLPMKLAKAIIAVKIPPIYVGKAYSALSKMGRIVKEAYMNDGTWLAQIEIPAGMQNILVEKVASLTRGEGDVKIIKTE